MRISLRKTSDLITPDLRRMAAAVKDKKPLLSAMGLAVVQLARRSFTNPALRPSAWAPRKDNKPHNLLLEHGTLRASLRLLSVSGSAVHVGSDRKYAAYHQFGVEDEGGTAKLPPRPFMPFDLAGLPTPSARQAVDRVLRARLAAKLKA